MKKLIVLLVVLAFTSVAIGGQLIPFKSKNELVIRVEGLDYPPTLSKDLRSGLATRIFLQLELPEAIKAVYLTEVRYDLWDEIFNVTIVSPNGISQKARHRSEEDVMKALGTLRLPTSVKLSTMNSTQPHTLSAHVLLNPIEKERVQKIRQWVAQNSVAASLDPSTSRPATQAMTGRFNEMFSTIFEQYSNGNAQMAVWQRRLTSRTFTLKELPDEKP